MIEHDAVPDLELEMFSQPRLLTAARAMVNNLARRLGFAEIHAGQVSLAVDEALCNVINHGYAREPNGRIEISVWAIEGDPAVLKVVIADRARQVDPDTIRSRDLDDIRPGGLGVYIIREIMDEVSYEKRDGGGMRLTMIKLNPGEPDEGAAETDDVPSSETGSVASDG